MPNIIGENYEHCSIIGWSLLLILHNSCAATWKANKTEKVVVAAMCMTTAARACCLIGKKQLRTAQQCTYVYCYIAIIVL